MTELSRHTVLPFSGLLVFLLCLLSFCNLYGQELIYLSGKILDGGNSQPLPFTQISVKNSALGTVTNDEGQFQLYLPCKFHNDTLLIAFLGYETQRKRISDLKGQYTEINLESKVLQLSEVEIVGLTPQEVIRRAVANIPANYGADSLILTAFIRSQKFVNNKLAEFTEAIIEDLKTGYFLYTRSKTGDKIRNSNVPRLLKGRVVSDTGLVNSMGDVGKRAGCLGCNFMNDLVEYYHKTVLDEKLFRYHNLTMKEIVGPGSGKIYHISFDQAVKNQTLYKGDLFIDGSSFAIIKIIQKPSFLAFDEFERKKSNTLYTINGIYGWVGDMPFLSRTICYSVGDGLWRLSSIQEEQWINFRLVTTGQRIRVGFKNDVVVTDISRDPLNIRNFKGDKTVGTDQRWDQIVGKPDTDFWATYNFLPIEEKLQKEVLKLNN